MPRGQNAQLAVDMYHALRTKHGWSAPEAWKGIALLLLSCEIWKNSAWQRFHDCVVWREANEFRFLRSGNPNRTLSKANTLTAEVGRLLGIAPASVCSSIGTYWAQTSIRSLQPHNLVGHAFRSILLDILKTFGDPALTYEEEVDPHKEFPGHAFATRSADAKIDIVARRGVQTVALISARWRFRHDRVDVIEEAHAYLPAARRSYPGCQYYAVLGEFSAARLHKVLENALPASPHGPIAAAVHFCPDLLINGLGENGRLKNLKSVAWLINESFKW